MPNSITRCTWVAAFEWYDVALFLCSRALKAGFMYHDVPALLPLYNIMWLCYYFVFLKYCLLVPRCVYIDVLVCQDVPELLCSCAMTCLHSLCAMMCSTWSYYVLELMPLCECIATFVCQYLPTLLPSYDTMCLSCYLWCACVAVSLCFDVPNMVPQRAWVLLSCNITWSCWCLCWP